LLGRTMLSGTYRVEPASGCADLALLILWARADQRNEREAPLPWIRLGTHFSQPVHEISLVEKYLATKAFGEKCREPLRNWRRPLGQCS